MRSRKPSRTVTEAPKPSIAAVLEELVPDCFVPTGFGWQRMPCPFHEDRTPSAAVNHEINGFICHSCGRSGDALKLLRDELRVSYREAFDRASVLSGGDGNRQPRKKRRPSDLLLPGGERT